MTGSEEKPTVLPISDPNYRASENEETGPIPKIPELQKMEKPLDLSVRKHQKGSDISNECKSQRKTSNRSGELRPTKRQRMTKSEVGIAHASACSAHWANDLPGTARNVYRPEQLIPPALPKFTAWGGHAEIQAAYFASQAYLQEQMSAIQHAWDPMFWIWHRVATNQNRHMLPAQVASGYPAAQTRKERSLAQDASKVDNRLQCPHCDSKLSRADHLRGHISNKHDDLHFCMVYYCGREFGSPVELEDHIEKDHKTDREKELKKGTKGERVASTVCPFCENSTPVDTTGWKHIRSCAGGVPLSAIPKCELHIPCVMFFRNAEEKAQHDETVHKNHRGFIKSA